jgi:peptide chain release factor 3
MFFGSASTTSACMEVLDALVDLAPPPGPRARWSSTSSAEKTVQPETKFSRRGVQDPGQHGPNHRDRIAFVRVASGKFSRGMRLKVVRSQGAAAQHRGHLHEPAPRAVDEAYAGDIIGIPNHGVLQLGDTLTEGEPAVHRPALLRARDVPHP